jgi:hypothetical protein
MMRVFQHRSKKFRCWTLWLASRLPRGASANKLGSALWIFLLFLLRCCIDRRRSRGRFCSKYGQATWGGKFSSACAGISRAAHGSRELIDKFTRKEVAENRQSHCPAAADTFRPLAGQGSVDSQLRNPVRATSASGKVKRPGALVVKYFYLPH